MPKRSSKPKDINEIATSIVRQTTGQNPPILSPSQMAAALGRLGGLKGGKARARKLSAEERSRIARKAAHSRWNKSPQKKHI